MTGITLAFALIIFAAFCTKYIRKSLYRFNHYWKKKKRDGRSEDSEMMVIWAIPCCLLPILVMGIVLISSRLLITKTFEMFGVQEQPLFWTFILSVMIVTALIKFATRK